MFRDVCPIRFLHTIVHEKQLKDSLTSEMSDFENVEPMEFYTVVYSPATRQISIMPNYTTMVRVATAKNITPEEAKESWARQITHLQKFYEHEFTEEQKNAFREYWLHSMPRDPERNGCWLAASIDPAELHAHKFNAHEPNLQAGLANDIFSYLSNIVVPCHYVVRSRFEKGFGPTGKLKRMTKHKPIFSVISGERIYRQFVEPSGDASLKCPHFRRGHIRHHWKAAGINRFLLPPDPVLRIRLVHEKQVPRSYIPPTWVGEGKWLVDGVLHEIVTEEIPLRQL